MSKRAEERALEAYPDKEMNGVAMLFHEQRRLFQEGYNQAEKDLALTWEDILIIHEKIRAVYDIAIMAEMDSKQIYEEALRRFNKVKED